jgi:hypothetical protein
MSPGAEQGGPVPEVISKYPDVTLKVLRSAGARCGEGAEQKILKKCPRDHFCSFPGGEVCVYGIEEIPRMTQVTARELAQVVCPPREAESAGVGAHPASPGLPMILALGLVAGRRWSRRRKKEPA